MKQYDYIIAGAGASGLSLVVHLIQSGRFSNAKILIVDKQPKTDNDRTWCFWDSSPGLFESIVSNTWNELELFTDSGNTIRQSIFPYSYKMIRSADFYHYCFDLIGKSKNVDVLYGEITKVKSGPDFASIIVDGNEYVARYVFNSIPYRQPQPAAGVYVLKQHFRGWFVSSANDVFDERVPTLMDFRTDQHHGTSFYYVMPFSRREALVEYTIFSEELIPDEKYDQALVEYFENVLHLNTADYKIESVENGVIPMTNYRFPISDRNIINIGTAGGLTKASTGYTFRFIQKHCAVIIKRLIQQQHPAVDMHSARHRFYDSVLLNILASRRMDGASIFSRLFNTNPMQQVFKFLDNETSIAEELRLISKLPTFVFSRAAISHGAKKIFKAVRP